MTAFLFLQRYEKGTPARMPYAPLMAILSRYGKAGRGMGDTEFTMSADTIAFGCTVIGDAETGALCVGFERPRYDAALRELAWECLTQLGCTLFNDTLDLVYTAPRGAGQLPAALLAAASCGVRAAGSAQQLWPEQLELATDGPARPALLYANRNSNGPKLQMFDHCDAQGKEMTIDTGIRPAACNAGTLRVLRNLALRVDATLQDNPGYKVVYRYTHAEASILLLESERLTDSAMQASIVCGMPGAPEPQQPDFVADSGVHAHAAREAAALSKHVQEKYQLTLAGDDAAVAALSGLLDKVHAFYCHERSKHAAGTPFHSALADTWAVRAGYYLGGVMRRNIGGQWGYIQRGLVRLPVLRTHSGRLCFPLQQVLGHAINGETDNIAAWYKALAESETSPTPRDEDLASDIPASAGMLPGGAALPFAGEIAPGALDFSVESLHQLDAYLARVARNVAAIPGPALDTLVLAAGAYLGEVVRLNTPDPACWQWVNYDDHVRANPDFAQRRARTAGFMAFLDSRDQTCYPLQHVAAYVSGQGVLRSVDFARKVLGVEVPDAPLAVLVDDWPADNVMADEVAHVRERLASWRRFACKSDFDGMRPAADAWLQRDSLGDILLQRDLLLREGQLVWAALVQANGRLFDPGPDNLPAALVYSLDPHFDSRPQALRHLAHTLFAQRGKQAPAYVQRIAAFLEDEFERAYDIPLPVEMSNREALVSVFVVFRQDVPDEILGGKWFPVLTHPSTRALMIAPRRFWSPRLLQLWAMGVLDEERYGAISAARLALLSELSARS